MYIIFLNPSEHMRSYMRPAFSVRRSVRQRGGQMRQFLGVADIVVICIEVDAGATPGTEDCDEAAEVGN